LYEKNVMARGLILFCIRKNMSEMSLGHLPVKILKFSSKKPILTMLASFSSIRCYFIFELKQPSPLKSHKASRPITLEHSSRRRQHNTTRTANTEEQPFSTLERVSETTLNSRQHKDNISGECRGGGEALRINNSKKPT
jgi:hypothetical protein